MKRIAGVVFLGGALLAGNVDAFDVKDAALFGGGLLSAGLIHEAGHQVEAWRTGETMDWHGLGKWHTNGHRYSTSLKMAGLFANAVSSEAILALRPQDRGWYLTGVLVGNIVEQVTYPTLRGNSGDFYGISDERKRKFQWLFVGHGLLTAGRMLLGPGSRVPGREAKTFRANGCQFFAAPVTDGAVAGVRWEW